MEIRTLEWRLNATPGGCRSGAMSLFKKLDVIDETANEKKRKKKRWKLLQRRPRPLTQCSAREELHKALCIDLRPPNSINSGSIGASLSRLKAKVKVSSPSRPLKSGPTGGVARVPGGRTGCGIYVTSCLKTLAFRSVMDLTGAMGSSPRDTRRPRTDCVDAFHARSQERVPSVTACPR
ncbi:hypothetical protein F2P81_004845 [Scophthalmus maximus]|uniref:Uncharacterized protein n=1 Tax=Scophthalmus maximus TaxID=52904 RepID=A0A6A4TGD7_SCOMX|nr:hypothetical protein F2P81_004845 [Scophthalmus maximus]